MSTSQRVETDFCCASETLYRDSVKRNKNKSKKLKSKEKGRHTSWKAEELLCSDDGFEASVTKKAKKLRKNKDKHHKQKKNKDNSELLLPLPVKQKKCKKSKSLGGSDQSKVNLLHQHAETLASQDIGFSDGGSDAYGSFRSQHPVSEGSHLLKQEPAQAQSHTHKKSKNGAPHRKSVVLDHLPCSLEYVSSQVKKRKERAKHMEAPEPSPPGPGGKVILLNSILEPRTACLTSEYEDKVLDPLRENDCKASQVTDENYNSEELFITQKTFLPAESSSEESIGAIGSFTEPGDGQRGGVCSQLPPDLFIAKSTTEKATQTDDFFSSPVLSTSFGIHKLRQKQECTEQALDLTVPKRPHREPSSGSADWRVKQEREETSCDPAYPKLTSTVSNEQYRMPALSKAGNAQLKVVQTRLNESFFFRMKGDGESPKPQSPLLDLGMSKSKSPQKKTYMKARRPSDLNS
ncbi:hypothetical protein SKAU_G00348440 [Synaphobranchus kaupii]|uniref:Uncharacterized protein n=1 Tax=Synaphobranchus kaupii TaxID=118154 RepID=A0A9Q1EJX9_SYNKA|nr:hypothetical protein SKAU_G00348440 [Synaphobranchus kaupii]